MNLLFHTILQNNEEYQKVTHFHKNPFTIILKSKGTLKVIYLTQCVSHLMKLGARWPEKNTDLQSSHILMITCAGLVSESSSPDSET